MTLVFVKTGRLVPFASNKSPPLSQACSPLENFFQLGAFCRRLEDFVERSVVVVVRLFPLGDPVIFGRKAAIQQQELQPVVRGQRGQLDPLLVHPPQAGRVLLRVEMNVCVEKMRKANRQRHFRAELLDPLAELIRAARTRRVVPHQQDLALAGRRRLARRLHVGEKLQLRVGAGIAAAAFVRLPRQDATVFSPYYA